MESILQNESAEPLKIFISYSHEDKRLKDRLITSLSALIREGKIKTWNDKDIDVSVEWKDELDTRLDTADIILLLISPDFIESEYCYSIEMARAMERHKAKQARVVPIFLRPTDASNLPFMKLQGAPADRPVTKWENEDEAFLDIVRKLRRVIEKMLAGKEE